MRLKKWEIDIILKNAKKIFGKEVKVYLFGSRIDDTKKGGDIDLYVESDDVSYDKQSKFWISLQIGLGEQKIDIIYNENPDREIEKVAKKTGIELKD